MISERQVARGFRHMWREITPLLTPHFVALFNVVYCHRIEQDDGTLAPPVRSHESTDKSMVAEFAFHVARLAQQQSISLAEVFDHQNLISDAENSARKLIQQYEGRKVENPLALTAVERSESALLVANYSRFLVSRGRDSIEFSPFIPGSGFVNSCNADLSVGTSLFEVKTVNRNIAGKDIRQLLVYLALQSATGVRRWLNAGFFNPRRARFYEFSIDSVLPVLSGGNLAPDVFVEMVAHFGTRDLQIDSQF